MADGEGALSAPSNSAYDLVVPGPGLPDMDGLSRGADDYLGKPFEAAEMFSDKISDDFLERPAGWLL